MEVRREKPESWRESTEVARRGSTEVARSSTTSAAAAPAIGLPPAPSATQVLPCLFEHARCSGMSCELAVMCQE